MLARHARLTKQDPIGLILRRGGLAHSPHLIARFQKNRLNHNRFTVIVSAKIYAKAVQRNRLRRQIYEIIRNHERSLTSSVHFNSDLALQEKRGSGFARLSVGRGGIGGSRALAGPDWPPLKKDASPYFWDIVILPKKSITMVKSYQEIQKSFEHLIPFIR